MATIVGTIKEFVMKILCKRSVIKTSKGAQKVTSRTWKGLIDELSSVGVDVDSAYRRRYEQFIIGYVGGDEVELEVTKYSDGEYEVILDNVASTNPGDVVDEYNGLTQKSKQELNRVMEDAMYQIFEEVPDADFGLCLDNVIGLAQDKILRNKQQYSKATVDAVSSNSRAFREMATNFVESNYDNYLENMEE